MSIKRWGKKLLPILTFFFFGLVAWLLYHSLAQIEWDRVQHALWNVSWQVLAAAAGMVMVNYAILASYDYLALRHLKVPLMPYPKVFLSAFICYALTLNVGAFVGGLGFRYRIYSGWKVARSKIPLIIFFSTLTNWLGYTFLLGIVFITRTGTMDELLPIPPLLIQALGVIACLAVLTYIVFCAKQSVIRVKNHKFHLPRPKTALLQLLLSCCQWTLLAAIIQYLLISLNAQVEYSQVLVTLLFAAIAGVITHIPAGLGVIETVFLRMQLDVHKSDLFVALICYRAVYYILPLLLAIPSYFSLEIYQKKNRTSLKAHQILGH
jgi:glycosyltransferase 2 family protein